jgi:hypothetical protein
MPLTASQSLFVAAYLVDLNATNAAIAAGSARSSAFHDGQAFLCNSDVRSAIAAEQSGDHALLTVGDVLEGLLEEATDNGLNSDARARVAAWGRIGEYMGMFHAKTEHSGGIELDGVNLELTRQAVSSRRT